MSDRSYMEAVRDPLPRMVETLRKRYKEIKEKAPRRKVDWQALLREIVRSEGFHETEAFTKMVKSLSKAYAEDKKKRAQLYGRGFKKAS